ncbi:Probable myosin-binding protein 4 [Linum perenne]
MTAKGASIFGSSRRSLRGLTCALKSAACEWLLIFLLFLDAVFAYLLTRFARYCKLQVPCILCSRLDHILGHEKPGFYRDLICTNHRAEISCLMFCQTHGKLADGRAMCDNCLLSFSATLKPPNSDNMQRLLVGKLGFDLGSNGPFTDNGLLPSSVATKLCSCCHTPWRSRHRADRILKLNSPGSAMSPRPNIPLPHRLTQQESLRRLRDKFSGSLTPCRLGNRGFDSLSHFGYTELKFNSDSESEFLYSDDDEYHNLGHVFDEQRSKEEYHPASLNSSDKAALGGMEQHHESWEQEQRSTDAWQDQADREALKDESRKLAPRTIAELISLDDLLRPSNLADKKTSAQNNPSVLNSDPSVFSEFMALVDSPSSFKASKGSDGIVTFNNTRNGALKFVENMAVDGTQVDPGEAPQANRKEHERVDDGLRPSSSRDTYASSSKDHAEVHESESKVIVDSSSGDIEMPPEPILKEKTQDSSVEALDLIVDEIEGETIEQRLRRQVEHDKTVISTLTKDLEEERSASAIATNQAMAMITRLQAEKSALHMEALQYLRMMEEQAEYDGEELEKVNDILAEREKELQDLEAELDHFKLKYPDDEEEVEDNTIGSCLPNNTTMSSTTGRDNIMAGRGYHFTTSSSYANGGEKDDHFTKSSWPDIKDEKSFIFQRLKSLERRVQKLSRSTTASPYMSDSEYYEDTIDRGGVDAGEIVLGNNEISYGQRTPNPQLETGEMGTLKNEVSDLNERLESLETDWSFLEHAFNSLENGKEGLQFVQEIAHRLQELRKLGLRSSSRYNQPPLPC